MDSLLHAILLYCFVTHLSSPEEEKTSTGYLVTHLSPRPPVCLFPRRPRCALAATRWCDAGVVPEAVVGVTGSQAICCQRLLSVVAENLAMLQRWEKKG